MAKRLIIQARGKGGPKYRAPSHRYFGKIFYANDTKKLLRGEVLDIINSVGHSAPLMVIEYENGDMSLLPATLGVRKGDSVFMGAGAPTKPGNVMKLDDIPSGLPVYNIETVPFKGGELVRTSGTAAQIIGKEAEKILIKLPSKKITGFNPNCRAIIGIVAGGGRTEKPWVKAGKKMIARKARGKMYPRTSGVAMNAVDHPHGGTHRRTKGRPTTVSRRAPPGRKVGLIGARRTGKK